MVIPRSKLFSVLVISSATLTTTAFLPNAIADEPDHFSGVLRALENGESAPLESLLIFQNGRLQLERYWPGNDRRGKVDFGPNDIHELRSCTKSIVGLLVGIAMDEGTLPPLKTPAHTLFPDIPPNPLSKQHRMITLEHLLLMRDGLRWDQATSVPGKNDESQLEQASNSVAYVWSRPMARSPGKEFRYNSGATTLLAGAIERQSGIDIESYAAEKLFKPLEISKWEWLRDYDEKPAAHYGLRIAPRDMLKIGRLVLQKGMWDGVKIVPAKWIESMSDRRSDDFRYGFQWWLDDSKVEAQVFQSIAAHGKGGQRISVFPRLNAVIVMTAGHYNDNEAAGSSNKLIAKHILPVLIRFKNDK